MLHTFSIKKSLIFPFLIVFFICAIIQNLYIYDSVSYEISKNVVSSSNNYINIHTNNINNYFDSIERLATTIKLDDDIAKSVYIDKSDDFYTQHMSNEAITNNLQTLSYSYEYIAGILLFTNTKSVYNYSSPFGFYDINAMTNTEITTELQKNKSGYINTIHNNFMLNSYRGNMFAYYENVYNKGELAYTLCIFIDSEIFHNILGNSDNITILSGENVIFPFGEIYEKDSDEFLSISSDLDNNWELVYNIPSDKIANSSYNIIQKLFVSFFITFILIFFIIL